MHAECGVRGFPTIKIFPGRDGKTSPMAKDYEFGRSVSNFVREALSKVDMLVAQLSMLQLNSYKLFDDTCTSAGKSTVCALIELPDVLGSSADKHNTNTEMFQGVKNNSIVHHSIPYGLKAHQNQH